MYEKTIKCEDFDGNMREEKHYFNLMESELVELELSVDGGLDAYAKRIANETDGPKLVELFKKLILMSYGEKSDDGKRFVKSPEIAANFASTNAYSTLFMELVTDSKAAAEFFVGIIPKNKQELIKKAEEEGKLVLNKE